MTFLSNKCRIISAQIGVLVPEEEFRSKPDTFIKLMSHIIAPNWRLLVLISEEGLG